MRTFMQSNLYAIHEEQFVNESGAEPPQLAQFGGVTVSKKDCSGWWRRFAATMLDVFVVAAIVQTLFLGANHAESADATAPPGKHGRSTSPRTVTMGPLIVKPGRGVVLGGVELSPQQVASATGWVAMPMWLALYSGLLVALVGQTPGMLITGLRVVRTDFRAPSLAQSAWRYTLVLVLWPVIVLLSPFSRVCLHDKLSYTRVIKTERVLARTALTA
jgi:uncharacterized RDD family membrane protein YckC